jgi:light-regulated signal transduction histidine kinase (bacteriophytochrome)
MGATLQPIDLDSCDQEPIHTPDSIQPHGLMLVAEARILMVSHAAGAIEARLGISDWVGQTLDRFIGDALTAEAMALGAAGGFVGCLATAAGEALDVTIHPSGAHIIVELEPASTEGLTASRVMDRITASASALAGATSLIAVCERAAAEFRRLTGFDRVMVYRFNDSNAGEVIAEDARRGMHSFLRHHFPASDIPAQARALYIRNVLRVIPDTAYEPAPLRPAWTAPLKLDMTDSGLRSVSPIHLQYLRNMGVRASASFSIIIDGMLWGLIACHHETARRLTYDVRSACHTLVDSLSRVIKAREEADGLRQRIRLHSFEDRLVSLLSRGGTLALDLLNHLDEVRRMLDAEGVTIIRGHEIVFGGVCPEPADIRLLAAWLVARSVEPVFSTERLSELYPPGAKFARAGSGVLSMTMSADEPWLVIWFRAEQTEIVNWAGNPHKTPPDDQKMPLSPRTSFESWSEAVAGKSRRWSRPELDAVARLRTALLEVQQTCRTRELNLQLTRLLQDKDQLLQQKEFLVGEINHRVQNSLQLVSSFLSMQARASDDVSVQDALREAGRRLKAVALVHRRLYRGDKLEMVDAAGYIEELCADTLAFMGKDWARQLTLHLSPALVSTDRAVALGLILTELLINANKHAYGGGAGPLRVELAEDHRRLRLSVADKGSGDAAQGRGFGSRIMAGLVAQLGGTLTRSDNDPGLSVTVSIPSHPYAKA